MRDPVGWQMGFIDLEDHPPAPPMALKREREPLRKLKLVKFLSKSTADFGANKYNIDDEDWDLASSRSSSVGESRYNELQREGNESQHRNSTTLVSLYDLQ